MKYGAPLFVDELSGKVGGVVFSRARSGPTVRVRVTPHNPRSAAQLATRAALTKASREFKALSSTDADGWNNFGLGIVFANGMGGTYHPSGIQAYVQLATVFLAINPTGTPPTTPPSSPYAGDTIGVTGGGGTAEVTFTPSAANTSGSTTELLIQPLPSINRKPSPGGYRTVEYHVFTGSSDVVTITEPVGYYALAYRFVKIATGERGPLVALGTFQAT
jgi:hypothetical protein